MNTLRCPEVDRISLNHPSKSAFAKSENRFSWILPLAWPLEGKPCAGQGMDGIAPIPLKSALFICF